MKPHTDDRGQMGASNVAKVALAIVIGLAVTALVAGLLVPIGINELNDDQTQTVTQSTGDTENLTASLDATLDSVDTGGDNATYTLSDGSSTATNTVDNGTTTTFSLDGGSVDVSPQDVSSGQATTTYSYAKDFGWSSGGSAMWGLLDMVIVLAVFLMVLGIAIKGLDAI